MKYKIGRRFIGERDIKQVWQSLYMKCDTSESQFLCDAMAMSNENKNKNKYI